MAGAAASIKWTGLTALALIGLIWLWDQRSLAASWGRRAGELAILGLIPLMLYVSVFWVHFRLLPASGEGDAFMTPKFQAGLQDSSYYDPTVRMSFGEKFIELNDEMFRANQTLTATHPYSSHWYAWPFQIRPIYYWQGPTLTDNRQGNIYLLGNPMIWWGLWAALVVAILYTGRLKRRLRPTTIAALAIAGAAYVMNFLPFMAVTRVMFLYHYLFAFCFSIIFVVMLWNDLANPKHDRLTGVPRRLYLSILALVALSFIFFAPLTFGAPLSPDELQARMWLTSWR
jgi:dolichyl-phosphate-mannose-protein mannosyltransferase